VQYVTVVGTWRLTVIELIHLVCQVCQDSGAEQLGKRPDSAIGIARDTDLPLPPSKLDSSTQIYHKHYSYIPSCGFITYYSSDHLRQSPSLCYCCLSLSRFIGTVTFLSGQCRSVKVCGCSCRMVHSKRLLTQQRSLGVRVTSLKTCLFTV
jgi:hypothetical protein